MSEALTVTPHRLLRTSEAAGWLGLSGRTLEKHRTFGTGPAYRKIGGRVVYALADLQTWADRGSRNSTTDKVSDGVHPARRPSEPRAFAQT
jgi:predicted DNA-binding transcriptional regulator AlpA